VSDVTVGAEVQLLWGAPTALETTDRFLNEAERARLTRLRRPGDQAGFRSAHVLARVAVARLLDVPYEEVGLDQRCRRCGGGHGRPVPVVAGGAAPWVSMTRNGGLVAVAVASVPVGIDLEQEAARAAGTPEGALSGQERAELRSIDPAGRRRAGLVWWVRKEAVLKAVGTGLAVEPRHVVISPPWCPAAVVTAPTGWPAVRVADVHLSQGVAAAVALVGTAEPRVVVEEVDLQTIVG
jgi:4'-phosphopantetheinyl transferase